MSLSWRQLNSFDHSTLHCRCCCCYCCRRRRNSTAWLSVAFYDNHTVVLPRFQKMHDPADVEVRGWKLLHSHVRGPSSTTRLAGVRTTTIRQDSIILSAIIHAIQKCVSNSLYRFMYVSFWYLCPYNSNPQTLDPRPNIFRNRTQKRDIEKQNHRHTPLIKSRQRALLLKHHRSIINNHGR